MKKNLLQSISTSFMIAIFMIFAGMQLNAQTNVFDDIIASSADHTYLKAALEQEGLDAALQDAAASLTVFAPTDEAIQALADALGTDIAGILALPNLSEVLTYHVIGSTVMAADVSNGAIVDALNPANTLKLTKTSMGAVFVNQASVTVADLSADNGVVHVIDAVVLPAETVVDVALDNGFSTLATAVVTAELLPALTNPLANFTVFAPTNEAFDALAAALGTDLEGILALPNLADVLTYHVLGSEVMAEDISNGDIVDALSMTNTLKITKTAGGDVFVNQAKVTTADVEADNGVVHILDAAVLPSETVVDVALHNGFTTLATAVITAELIPALSNPFAKYTVFAPTNEAFDALATTLGTDLEGILALPNLADVLTYHVLGSEVKAEDINNGDVVNALSATNTLKLTKTAGGDVYVNQANVTAADIEADNGIIHVLDAAVLPSETVVDIALDNGFSTLATAVITAELIPALSNPFAKYTVFAPTNDAFDALASSLGTDLAGILALPNLADVLTYHVLGSEVMAEDINNGDVVDALSMTNTLKLTKTAAGEVFVNQAMVTGADVTADNGVVHILDAAVLPSETVVDVALDNGFSTLATAVITAELIPALSNPFAKYTVFAPTNDAFDALASSLGTDLAGILALPNLADVLTYHVLGTEVMAEDINNGDLVDALSMTNTLKLTKTAAGEVFVNQAMVTGADVTADNGVVHILDAAVLPSETVVDVALDNGFSTLATAVITAELIPALSNPFAKYTVFAPTNDAFDALATTLGTDLEGILALPNLAEVLTYHVVAGEFMSTDLVNGDIETLNGSPITIDLSNGVMVNEQNVVLADVESDNGVVHVIDGVLLPMSTSTDEIETGMILKAFPNPAQDVIFVEGPLNSRFQIMDIQGSLLKQGILDNDQIIVSDLNSGTYMIRLVTETSIEQGKFIKI